jgi:phosphoribosylamine--glycine ligase
MNVLLIGSGGREHALAYSISKSPTLGKLFITPGNPGTENLGENVFLDQSSRDITDFCSKNNIEFVVIGPENPLVNGLADSLRANGIIVFGPGARAAEIEAHKSFAKKLMKDYNIPTASFAEFNSEEFEDAISYLKENKYPLVIKADGLAAGKGVMICYDFYSKSVRSFG